MSHTQKAKHIYRDKDKNLYDLLGCVALALDASVGPIIARNLRLDFCFSKTIMQDRTISVRHRKDTQLKYRIARF